MEQHKPIEPEHHYGEVTEMVGAEEYNPYCKECDGCGEEGCCSPLNCKQSANGRYCATYLMDLKFGYIMNSFFNIEIFGLMSEELKEKYDKEFDKQ